MDESDLRYHTYKLADFGLITHKDVGETSCGTNTYKSPEMKLSQSGFEHRVTPKSDVYSLWVTFLWVFDVQGFREYAARSESSEFSSSHPTIVQRTFSHGAVPGLNCRISATAGSGFIQPSGAGIDPIISFVEGTRSMSELYPWNKMAAQNSAQRASSYEMLIECFRGMGITPRTDKVKRDAKVWQDILKTRPKYRSMPPQLLFCEQAISNDYPPSPDAEALRAEMDISTVACEHELPAYVSSVEPSSQHPSQHDQNTAVLRKEASVNNKSRISSLFDAIRNGECSEEAFARICADSNILQASWELKLLPVATSHYEVANISNGIVKSRTKGAEKRNADHDSPALEPEDSFPSEKSRTSGRRSSKLIADASLPIKRKKPDYIGMHQRRSPRLADRAAIIRPLQSC
jgi:hypothetical protein